MEATGLNRLAKAVHYDSARRRLWIAGQRCHHGATGALLAAAGVAGAATARVNPAGMVGLLATGGLLMAHDWKDRSIWFERGFGTQP